MKKIMNVYVNVEYFDNRTGEEVLEAIKSLKGEYFALTEGFKVWSEDSYLKIPGNQMGEGSLTFTAALQVSDVTYWDSQWEFEDNLGWKLFIEAIRTFARVKEAGEIEDILVNPYDQIPF